MPRRALLDAGQRERSIGELRALADRDPDAESWIGRDVLKAKRHVVADRNGDGRALFALKGSWIPVLREEGRRLRVRGYDGQEGWADKADFVLLRDAIAFFSEAIRRDQKDAWAWSMRGVARAMRQEYDAAIEDYSQAIRLDPTAAACFVGRGGAWGAKGEFDRAIRDYDEAIRLDARYAHPLGAAHVFNARGNMWGAKKDFDKAIRDYDEAIRLDPNFALALNHRGNAWSEKQQWDKAIADYTQAIRLGVKDVRLRTADPSVFVDRGNAWLAKKQYARAVSDYDEAIALDADYAMALTRKAYLLAACADDNIRDVTQARILMTRAVNLQPRSPYNEEVLGVIAAAQGKFAEAIKHQKKALEAQHYADREGDKARTRLAAYEQKKPCRE